MHKILLVEDDLFLRQAIEALLREEQYEVLTAESGEEGLEQAIKIHPDLILLDYQLPTLSGLDVLKRLRDDDWGVTAQIVFLTNNSDTRIINETLRENVHDYIIKADMSGEAIKLLVRQKLLT